MPDVMFVTVDEVKSFINITISNTDYDDKLETIIKTASSLISNKCRRQFKEEVYTQYFGTRYNNNVSYDLGGDASNVSGISEYANPQRLSLKAAPANLSEDFKVYYDTSRDFEESTLLTLGDDYYIDEELEDIVLLITTAESGRSIKVVYTAGYAEAAGTLSGTLPEDLKMACITQAVFLFDKYESSSIGISAQSEEQGKEYASNSLIPQEVVELINPYRVNLFGKN